jgi:hypothetical protein
MRPTLPPATPSADEPAEAATGKMAAVPEGRQRCPRCNGSTLLDLEPVDPTEGKPDLSKFGVYRFTRCSLCSEEGTVSAVEAEAIRAAMK